MLPRLTSAVAILLMAVQPISAFSCNTSIDPGTDYCHPWAIKKTANDICKCSDKRFLRIDCFNTHTVMTSHVCAFYDNQSHVSMFALCPFNSHKQKLSRHFLTQLPNESIYVNSFMCDPLNRTGLFCSHCKDGLGPALLNYTYPCLECSKHGWVTYIVAAVLPVVLFCVFIIAFHIDVTSPYISYAVLHCQMIINFYHKQPNLLVFNHYYLEMVIITLCGFWNLEFFRTAIPSFCVSTDMNTNTVIALEYIVALCPLLLIAIVYAVIEMHAGGCKILMFLWRPFHPCFVGFKKSWNIRGSVINAFTTFLCLSYSKIVTTSFLLLYRISVVGNCENSLDTGELRSYLNASLSGRRVITLYFFPAVLIPFFFCIMPLVFLICHPTKICRRCLNHFKYGRLLHEMAKIFSQHYNDGTENSRDCRWMAGLHLAIRFMINSSSVFGKSYFVMFFLLFTFTYTLIFAIVRPYKEDKFNHLDTFWFATLTIVVFCQLITFHQYSLFTYIPFAVGILLPILYLVIAVPLKYFLKICQKCCVLSLTYPFILRPDTESSDIDDLPHRFLNPSEYKPLITAGSYKP